MIIEYVIESVVLFIVAGCAVAGYSVQLYWGRGRQRPPIKQWFHRVGFVASILQLTASLDPSAANGIYPTYVPAVLINFCSSCVYVCFAIWLYFTIGALYHQLRRSSPTITKFLVALSLISSVCSLIGSLLEQAMDRAIYWTFIGLLPSGCIIIFQAFVAVWAYCSLRRVLVEFVRVAKTSSRSNRMTKTMAATTQIAAESENGQHTNTPPNEHRKHQSGGGGGLLKQHDSNANAKDGAAGGTTSISVRAKAPTIHVFGPSNGGGTPAGGTTAGGTTTIVVTPVVDAPATAAASNTPLLSARRMPSFGANGATGSNDVIPLSSAVVIAGPNSNNNNTLAPPTVGGDGTGSVVSTLPRSASMGDVEAQVPPDTPNTGGETARGSTNNPSNLVIAVSGLSGSGAVVIARAGRSARGDAVMIAAAPAGMSTTPAVVGMPLTRPGAGAPGGVDTTHIEKGLRTLGQFMALAIIVLVLAGFLSVGVLQDSLAHPDAPRWQPGATFDLGHSSGAYPTWIAVVIVLWYSWIDAPTVRANDNANSEATTTQTLRRDLTQTSGVGAFGTASQRGTAIGILSKKSAWSASTRDVGRDPALSSLRLAAANGNGQPSWVPPAAPGMITPRSGMPQPSPRGGAPQASPRGGGHQRATTVTHTTVNPITGTNTTTTMSSGTNSGAGTMRDSSPLLTGAGSGQLFSITGAAPGSGRNGLPGTARQSPPNMGVGTPSRSHTISMTGVQAPPLSLLPFSSNAALNGNGNATGGGVTHNAGTLSARGGGGAGGGSNRSTGAADRYSETNALPIGGVGPSTPPPALRSARSVISSGEASRNDHPNTTSHAVAAAAAAAATNSGGGGTGQTPRATASTTTAVTAMTLSDAEPRTSDPVTSSTRLIEIGRPSV